MDITSVVVVLNITSVVVAVGVISIFASMNGSSVAVAGNGSSVIGGVGVSVEDAKVVVGAVENKTIFSNGNAFSRVTLYATSVFIELQENTNFS